MTAPKRPAIDEACDLIDSVRDTYAPIPYVPARFELDALPSDLLRRIADEKDCAVTETVDRLIEAAADRADALAGDWATAPVDVYNPDDREPMGGDPYWRDDDR